MNPLDSVADCSLTDSNSTASNNPLMEISCARPSSINRTELPCQWSLSREPSGIFCCAELHTDPSNSSMPNDFPILIFMIPWLWLCRCSFRHLGGLPRHRLPFAVAFQKCSRVAEVAGGYLAFFSIVHDQAEVHHGHIAIRMDGEIVCVIGGLRRVRGANVDIFEDVGLGYGQAGGPRIDHVIGKEILEDRGIILRHRGQKVAHALCHLLDDRVVRCSRLYRLRHRHYR